MNGRHWHNWYTRKPVIWTGAILGALLLAAAFVWALDLYPIMIVNGRVITVARFEENAAAAKVYYANLVKTYTKDQAPQFDPEEVEAGVLTQLVDYVLIDSAVRAQVGRDREALVAAKLEKYAENASLAQAAPALYGLDLAAFKREVLVPQAERDILAGRLFLEGKDLDDWLLEEGKRARVRIFSSKFRWTGDRVEIAR